MTLMADGEGIAMMVVAGQGERRMGSACGKPPYSLEAEQAVLGAILVEETAFSQVASVLNPGHFYEPAHQHIYAACEELVKEGKPPDPILVQQRLDAKGLLSSAVPHALPLSLARAIGTTANVQHYANLLVELRAERAGGPAGPLDKRTTTDAVGSSSTRPLTDAGNAERFVSRNAESLRYVNGRDAWLVWDGARWARDDRREVYGRAIASARSIRRESADVAEAAKTPKEMERADALARWAHRSENVQRLDATLKLARTMSPLATVPDDLDRDRMLLNVPNGTIDLRTGELARHDPARLLTKLAPIPFDVRAEAPTWAAFLARIVPDAAIREFLQRAVGYSLTGSVAEQSLFFCYGMGANGKSTFLETVRSLLGETEYAKAAAPDLLLAKKQDRHQAEIADLCGARFVTTVEVGEGRSWDEARVKWLTGGDTISARWMHGNPFTFQPTHKLWIAGNHKPRVHGTDLGFWRRVNLIPFTVTIPKEEQDAALREKLAVELPGILRWAVEGCTRWQRDGLCPPPAVLAATQAYRSSEDVVAVFIEECCAVDPRARVAMNGLFETFLAWAERNGERPMTKRALGDALEERGYERARTGAARWVLGLSLRSDVGERAA